MRWLIDAYRANNKVVLWVKTKEKNIRIEKPFKVSLYLDTYAEKFLQRNKIDYLLVEKITYTGRWKKVCEVKLNVMEYESFVKWVEKRNKYGIKMYNADVPPEQQFLYQKNLVPGCAVDEELNVAEGPEIELKKVRINFYMEKNSVELDGKNYALPEFVKEFNNKDPDVILMNHAFSKLPKLVEKLEEAELEVPFHRWDRTPIRYKGGKPFFSYGAVKFRDFAIRLKGRFLVDTSSTIGEECDVDRIMELCKLTGARFQQIASRSFGAAFQHSLVRLLFQNNCLVPYKEKPVDIPISVMDLLKGDRGGHTFDAIVGMHKDVAEIDFTSMFPWIIYNKNISADTILGGKPPYEYVPGLPIKISHHQRGIIPQAIKPLIDKRMYYKKNPTLINKNRAAALKWVLVTAYGYLRFREFKLGIASSHMAICAYAREIIIQAARLAEQKGFKIMHGIIDSLYIQKKGITKQEVDEFCKELEQLVGIPASNEGLFKWIVFLPSVNDVYRPVPTCYYGVFENGEVKARGIEVRQRKTPKLVKMFQQQVLEEMAQCVNKKEIAKSVPYFCSLLRETVKRINDCPAELLTHKIRISTDKYKSNIPQKKAVDKLRRKGVKTFPGMNIEYLVARGERIILPKERGRPDLNYYRKLLVRSLFVILQPFGITRNYLMQKSGQERQLKVTDFSEENVIKIRSVAITKQYKDNKGLSERQIRKLLEKQGWEVWRGSMMNVLKIEEIYPNVRKKYSKLLRLLAQHCPKKIPILQYCCSQSGMPDFICYRNGKFKFVECKLNHEQLSKTQKKCIQRLQAEGFEVEVLKFVDESVRQRKINVNYELNRKKVLEEQKAVRAYA